MHNREPDHVSRWHAAPRASASAQTTQMHRMVLDLQRAAGNKAVQQLLRPLRRSPPDQPVQRCGETSHAGCACLDNQPQVAGTDATADFDLDGQLFQGRLDNAGDLAITAQKQRLQRQLHRFSQQMCSARLY